MDSLPLLSLPREHADPYMGLGSHPDIVQRVWDQLGASLPAESRVVVCGTPALIETKTSVILALAQGTAYVLRVPLNRVDEAVAHGCRREQRWSDRSCTNAEEVFGLGWLFGGWNEREIQWTEECVRAAQAGAT